MRGSAKSGSAKVGRMWCESQAKVVRKLCEDCAKIVRKWCDVETESGAKEEDKVAPELLSKISLA